MTLAGVLLPMLVWAQTTSTTSSVGKVVVDPNAIDTPSEAFWLIKMMVKAFQDKNWALGAAFVLTAVVAGLRYFEVGKKIPKEWMPWFVGGTAMATSVAVGLYAGLGWLVIVTTGLSVGLMAMGGWSTVGKLITKLINKIRGKKEEPPKAESEGGS
jgi:hypothetical protein